LGGDSKTFNSCSSYVSTIQAVEKQKLEISKPLTKLLTEISRFVHHAQVEEPRTSAVTATNSLLMFIPRATSVQQADDGETIGPDIVGVEATAEEIVRYLEEDVLPHRLSSLRWSRLVSVSKIKLTDVPDQWKETDMLQLLSYVWCVDRCQPNRFIHTAFLAFKTGFTTLRIPWLPPRVTHIPNMKPWFDIFTTCTTHVEPHQQGSPLNSQI
jgi:hypothetical protein